MVESLAFKRTGWTKVQWAMTSLPRWTNMIHRRTTRQALVGSLVCKVTVWTSLPWAGSMWRRWTSTTVSKVGSSSCTLSFVYCKVTLYINLCPPDYKDGFGGKFGVQTDRQDKSALGWDHIEKVNKHESQKGEICPHLSSCFYWSSLIDYKTGFGGKFGVAAQNDKSALGWEHHEKVDKHESQKGIHW